MGVVLGDVLAWGVETLKPAVLVDLATLTGIPIADDGSFFANLSGSWGTLEIGGEVQRVAPRLIAPEGKEGHR